MRSDPMGLFEATIVAFSLGDIDSTFAFFAEDSQFAIYLPGSDQPVGRTYDGVPAMRTRLNAFVANFATEKYKARTILADGEGLRTQIDYSFRHRATGVSIDGVMRVRVAFRDGKMVLWHEIHDADRIAAFARLIESHEPVIVERPTR